MSAVLAEAFPASRVPVVNVSTVPQRSPLRYPGGKTWLIPHIREWLRHTRPKILIEPFAGGAIVSLTAVMERLVNAAVMVEIDRDVAAFWRSALESGATLREWIGQFEPTLERLRELEKAIPATVTEHGFRTLVLNRTRRGGILAPGARMPQRGKRARTALSLVSRDFGDAVGDAVGGDSGVCGPHRFLRRRRYETPGANVGRMGP